MKIVTSILTVLLSAAGLYAAEDSKPEAIKATYSITGLHCPPCTRIVESSLRQVKGVRSAKVDWTSKSAKVEFDEGVLSAQKLAKAVTDTPHMMGAGMSYGGWLALKVPDVKDEASAKVAKDALSKVSGVVKVSALPAQHTVSVQFSDKGEVTSKELISSLDAAGMKAVNY